MKTSRFIPWFLLVCVLAFGQARAAGTLELQAVTDTVYAIVGERGNRSTENLGNNATFGFVVTAQGVVLIDSGGTWRGAAEIARLIKTVTDQPVVKVINTGGQDHRWMGNGYFQERGAEIIASQAALRDHRARAQDQFIGLGFLVGKEYVEETTAVYAEQTFESELSLDLGGTRFELYHAGPAHTPGDSFVWLPREQVMFTGDIVYVERMLGVIPVSSSKNWLVVFEKMAAFEPQYLVPGHGRVTDLSLARKDTYDYLQFLRTAVADFIDDGGDISEIGSIDQAGFSYLLNFEQLAGRNAQQVFTEMEWE